MTTDGHGSSKVGGTGKSREPADVDVCATVTERGPVGEVDEIKSVSEEGLREAVEILVRTLQRINESPYANVILRDLAQCGINDPVVRRVVEGGELRVERPPTAAGLRFQEIVNQEAERAGLGGVLRVENPRSGEEESTIKSKSRSASKSSGNA